MFVRSQRMKTPFHILLGTNIGDRNKNLEVALLAIEREIGTIIKRSSVYQTDAWGKTDQAPFYNQVIELRTSLLPHDVLKELMLLEQKMGRRRTEVWGERLIDLDILLNGKEIIETSDLIIPHPQMVYRRFTLVPLNEIASEFIHPVFQKSISELLDSCVDKLRVMRI